MKSLREVLQDRKKLHIEAEPKANEIIHIKEEKEEKWGELNSTWQKCQNSYTVRSLKARTARSGFDSPVTT